jgi:hypothetical protein
MATPPDVLLGRMPSAFGGGGAPPFGGAAFAPAALAPQPAPWAPPQPAPVPPAPPAGEAEPRDLAARAQALAPAVGGGAPGGNDAAPAAAQPHRASMDVDAPGAGGRGTPVPQSSSERNAAAAAAAASSAADDDDAGANAAETRAAAPRRYKGVSWRKDRWVASLYIPARPGASGRRVRIGSSHDAREAAQMRDGAARAWGLREMNFPRAGTEETQAHFRHAPVDGSDANWVPKSSGARVRKAPAARKAARRGKQKRDAMNADGAAPRKAPPRINMELAALLKPPSTRKPAPRAATPPPKAQPEAPAPAPAAAFDGAHAPDATAAAAEPAIAEFLRGITPSLTCLDASLAAAARSGTTAAHLERIAGAEALCREDRAALVVDAARVLRNSGDANWLAFKTAMALLAPPRRGGDEGERTAGGYSAGVFA